jgi:hypothetical protein
VRECASATALMTVLRVRLEEEHESTRIDLPHVARARAPKKKESALCLTDVMLAS